MRIRRGCIVVAVIIGALLLPPAGSSTATAAPGDPAEATFEGREIDLGESWEEAQACVVTDDGTRCYRSERQMDLEEPMVLLADCSTTLRLYRSTSYGGGMLALTQRGVIHTLSAYGFNNDTSSYRVGACSSSFYDGGYGSGLYPGNTSAGVSATSMLAGWDNRISTVYIN